MTSMSIFTAAAIGLGALFVQPAQAQSPSDKPLTWSLGVEGHYQDYREPTLGVEEEGWFGGLTGEARYQMSQWQLRGDARYAMGSMDYTGSGRIDNIDDSVFEGRLMVGYAFPFGDRNAHTAVPYVGYGYRRLVDELGGTTSSTGARGYDRTSQYHYVPLGLELTINAADGWSFKPTVEYDHLITGKQESELSQAVAGLSDVSNTQDSGYGLRASFMSGTTLGALPVEFGPFIRYWNIDKSDIAPVSYNGVTVGGGYEPANETYEVGLALKVWF